MQTVRIQRLFHNPGLGLLPYTLYVFLYILGVPIAYSATISLVFAVFGSIFSTIYLRDRNLGLSFEISVLTLIFVLFVKLIGNHYIVNDYAYIIIAEVILIVSLMILSFAHVVFKTYMRRGRDKVEKALLNDYIFSVDILQKLLVLHLLVSFVVKQITYPRAYRSMDYFLYLVVPLVLVWGMYLYQTLRIRHLEALLKKEEWLPIVNERGQVTGRIARRVSRNMRNKYRHPVIRLIMTIDNKVYLQNRAMTELHDPGKIDHPLEKYVTYSADFNETLNILLSRVKGATGQIPEFLMEYSFESKNTKRLIYVYSLKIENEKELTENRGFTGKFWSIKQIEEEFNDSVFSECFELEYEYVKNVLLLNNADNIFRKDSTE